MNVNKMIINIQKIKEKQLNHTTYHYAEFHNTDYSYNDIQKLFFCIYRIKNDNIPFIEYLLYQYESNHFCIFPFIQPNPQKKLNNHIHDFMKKKMEIEENNWNIKNIIQENDNLYIIIQTNIFYPEDIIEENKKGTIWRWCLIDEICNHRHTLKYPIHQSVTTLFLNHPLLIYMIDNNGNTLPIPRIFYLNCTTSLLSFYYTFKPPTTIETNKYNYYHLSSNFKKNNGVIRYAVFLGKFNVWTTLSTCPNHTDFDSFIVKKKNISEFILKTKYFNQQISLTMHEYNIL